MKLADLRVADGSHQDMLALASDYDAIAHAARDRYVREEARFKTLLIFHLDDLTYRCVKKLSGFLRDFAYGRLRQEAEALLVEILPEVLRSLLDRRLYIEATSIVAEHRDILAQTRFPQDILHRMAESFQNIGLHDRATKIYEYMLSTAATDRQRRRVFPALIESYYRQHNFRAVREFAEYFLREFPEAKARARVYLLRARSLFAEGKLKQAEQLLTDRDRPLSRDLEVLTGRVLRARGKHAQVERYLSRVDVTRGERRGQLILERADSLVRCGCRKQALKLLERLQTISAYRERATYRMGQILFDLGQNERALKILRPLADNNSGSLWSRLARETMAVRQF
jgi:outer membrane protein assembly factor BamD (BamD/ComL family)